MRDHYLSARAHRSKPLTHEHLGEDADLRSAFSRFATGVCVVSYAVEDQKYGITVNSLTSVSVDPPLLLISIRKTSRSRNALTSGPFAVNVLADHQLEIAQYFAGSEGEEPQWDESGQAPRLFDPLAWFECTPWATYDGGDHDLIVGHINSFDSRRGDGLGFNGAQYTTIARHELGREFLL